MKSVRQIMNGHGFIAETSMNLDGKHRLPCTRDMVISPSSMGCLKTSSTFLLNSGSSSRKSIPLWARLISPGVGVVPPPTSAASEIVW